MRNRDNQPLVSIMMPVLNGEYFLPRSLDSLLAQDYPHFEIIILDNLSTDNTPAICQQYTQKDPRIRYILDNRNRNPHDANNHLATLAWGEYCMFASDDDLWEPNFISRLLPVIAADPKIALVFSNADDVDMEDNFSRKPMLKHDNLYKSTNSKFANCWHYLISRHIVPLIFGIFHTASLKHVLPFTTFDETIDNVDNLFMFKLLSMFKVESVDEILFHYRKKKRESYHKIMGNYPQKFYPFAEWIFMIKHQLRFTKKIFDVIVGSAFSPLQQIALRIRAIYSVIMYSTLYKIRSFISRIVKGGGWRCSPPLHDDHQAAVRHHALLEKKNNEVAKP